MPNQPSLSSIDLITSGITASPHGRTIEARRIRKHLLLKSLLERGAMSRIDLARHLDFNYRSTTLLVDEMAAQRLVIEDKVKPEAGRGRPPQPVRLNVSAAMMLGLALGRTGGEAVALNLAGQPLATFSVKSAPLKSAEGRIRLGEELAGGVMDKLDGASLPLAGVGVALGDPVELAAGMRGTIPPYDPATPAGAIHQALSRQTGAPVLIESHARAKALASHWFGAGRSYKSFAYLNLGDNPGLGVVMDHQIMQGTAGYAGEIGLAPGFTNGRTLVDKTDVSGLTALLTQIAVFYNPEAIIISGHGELEREGMIERVRAAFAAQNLPGRLSQTALHGCDLGTRALGLGAAAIILHRIYYPAPEGVAQVL